MSRKEEAGLSTEGRKRQLILKGSATIMITITIGMLLFGLAWLPAIIEPSGHPVLLKFHSYLELRDFLNNTTPSGPYYYYVNVRGGLPVLFAAAESKDVSVDYSRTNIQVEGVDEADIIKSDGEYIYFALNDRVLIVKAYPPEEAYVVSEIKLNGTVAGLFINGNRLVVFESGSQDSPILRPQKISYYYWLPTTSVKVYDVADKERPFLARNVSSDGGYFSSRMIGDYVYVVVTKPAYILEGEVTLPVIVKDHQVEEVPATSIYYANVSDYYYGFTTILAINVRDDSVEPAHETFLIGSSGGVYVSQSNIYLAIPRYDSEAGFEKTEIHRIHVQGNSIKSEASGEVPGYILNQFSMDEHGENFRIATTTSQVEITPEQLASTNNIYVLDMNLTIVGRLENLAPGESIYSARFMGTRCYLVTFKKVDPLFVIGLEDPANPVVLGKLKIPGYSDYLHPYNENLMIGIGKETVEAEEGDFAWYQGVKISLFDVSDVENPQEIAKYEIGDRGTDSPVLWDHKAFLFDRERNLLAFPVLVAEIDEDNYPEGVPPFAYGDFVWQGVYVFNITESSLTLRGEITYIENMEEFLKSGYYFYSDYDVQRALYIDDLLYTVSNKMVRINNLADLQQINEVHLP